MRLALAQASREAVLANPVLLRASATLVAAHVAAPEPAVAERFAVMTGLAGSHATGRDARLAETLVSMVNAGPGQFPGTIDITASNPEADVAARMADAVAEAFVGDQDDRATESRHQREVAAETRLASTKEAAVQARARFTALGGVSVDPAQARASAAAATAAAQARLDVIRSIIASGSPPISDRRDVPDPIAAAQRTYLDLSAQLSKAHETLGDRHTTIITLREGVARAAAEVTAAWKRLDHAAHADLDAAREREANVRKADTPADAARRTGLEEARTALQSADQAVAIAEAARREIAENVHVYKLIARAPIPAVTGGFSMTSRALLTALAGFATLALVVSLRRRRKAPPEPVMVARSAEPPRAQKTTPLPFFDREPIVDEKEGDDAKYNDSPVRNKEPLRRLPERVAAKVAAVEPRPAIATSGLREALREMLIRFETMDPHHGVPTLMIGANDADAGTASLALTLSIAAAATGRRVLVVESDTRRTTLAASVQTDAEPVLVDVFGMLRIVLQAEAGNGLVHLAPAFDGGARLASTLARRGEAAMIDDLEAAFDLVVVDGGPYADEIPADAYLRVGRFTSRRDDERFIAAADVPAQTFLGTMIGAVFVPWTDVAMPATSTPVAARSADVEELRPLLRRSVVPRQPVERRRAASR